MKPAPFTYHRPTGLGEALELLSAHPEAKVLAGGQSLLPLLNMRLMAPEHLVDIGRIAELDRLEVAGRPEAAGLRIGALVTHARAERSSDAAAVQPLLGMALRCVAHATIRNRGTVVGSVCHADSAAEMPAVMTLLGGEVQACSVRGERSIPAGDFFVGPMESALEPDELARSITLPGLPPDAGVAFEEISRRHGDYALCGAGAFVRLGAAGAVSDARIVLFSVAETATVVDVVEPLAAGTGRVALDDAAALARDAVVPEGDIHATAGYRRHLTGVLARRVLRHAVEHAVSRREGDADDQR